MISRLIAPAFHGGSPVLVRLSPVAVTPTTLSQVTATEACEVEPSVSSGSTQPATTAIHDIDKSRQRMITLDIRQATLMFTVSANRKTQAEYRGPAGW